jgi:GNAT superfamily N-acetyltransferase
VADATDSTSIDALDIQPVVGEAAIVDWQYVHNVIIPADPLSLDEVRERVGRNHLTVAYLGDDLVGCATVRPPAHPMTARLMTKPPGGTATVIARILPDWRRRGLGTRLYADALAHARGLGAGVIETVVWAGNPAGLEFAEAHGFIELERYTLEGARIPYVTLRRMSDPVG